jgi:protoheme ferro-lyase
MKTLYSLIESPFPPDFRALYQKLGVEAEHFTSARNLHRALQKQPPDFFVGEFVYGWGNNYAGANVSNLDVTIRTLQRFAPQAKVIVFMHPREADHIGKLLELFPIHAVLAYPVSEQSMEAALQ